jgi:hypothetical protein
MVPQLFLLHGCSCCPSPSHFLYLILCVYVCLCLPITPFSLCLSLPSTPPTPKKHTLPPSLSPAAPQPSGFQGRLQRDAPHARGPAVLHGAASPQHKRAVVHGGPAVLRFTAAVLAVLSVAAVLRFTAACSTPCATTRAWRRARGAQGGRSWRHHGLRAAAVCGAHAGTGTGRLEAAARAGGQGDGPCNQAVMSSRVCRAGLMWADDNRRPVRGPCTEVACAGPAGDVNATAADQLKQAQRLCLYSGLSGPC